MKLHHQFGTKTDRQIIIRMLSKAPDQTGRSCDRSNPAFDSAILQLLSLLAGRA